MERAKGFVRRDNVWKESIWDGIDPTVGAYMEEVPAGYVVIPQPPSLILYLYQKLTKLERETGLMAVLQTAPHPAGLALMVRLLNLRTEKEYHFTHVISLNLVENNQSEEIVQADILFDTIFKSLNSLQIIPAHKLPH